MKSQTWTDLPAVGDGHPSIEPRYQPRGIAPDGTLDYHEWYPPCGEWVAGVGNVYCQAHLDLLKAEYPQGWNYYPGDVCRHGRYTGGCGVDWMCGPCEMGDE